MTNADLADIASVPIGLIALGVSLISLYKTSKFNARQNELAETAEQLNRLLIEREKSEDLSSKKADISANLVKIGKSDTRLRVYNRGKGVARNLRLIELDEGHSILIGSDIAGKFPVPILDQHQNVDVIAAITLGSKSRVHIKLVWDDDTGENHEKELTPSL